MWFAAWRETTRRRRVADDSDLSVNDPMQVSLKPLMRADSAFFGHPTIGAAIRGGADVSVTVRLDSRIGAAIATIPHDAWTPIEYTDALCDEQSKTG